MINIRTALGLAFIVLLGSWKPIENNYVTKSSVEWLTIEEALELHSGEPRKLLVDLYTNWCGWCKVMDRETYGQADIAEYINKNFYPVKFNAEQKASVSFRGHTFNYVSQGRRGVHELAAALTSNRLSYPTTVFLDEELRILQPIPGYLRPEQMDPILKYFGDNHFKTTQWVEFTAQYQADIE
ncbi:MAG: DUF255 domain-containing protein [Bacteroidota bacterium]